MSDQPDPVRAASDGKMSLGSAAAVVTASMIGAGVYTTSGFSLADLGSPGYVILAWIIGGLIAICGAFCYAGLARQFTESGGEYLFLARAIHPAAGMTAGWVSLLAGFTGAMAFAATTFESYARETGWQGLESIPETGLAIGLILFAGLVHSLGLRGGTRIQDVVVLAKLALIVLFLLAAYGTITSWHAFTAGSLGEVTAPAVVAARDSPSGFAYAIVFANALTWISLSYSGFNAAVYMTDEIRSPRRNVPRAMILATVLVTVLYVLLNAMFVLAPPPDQVSGQPNVATLAAESIGDQWSERGVASAASIGDLVRIMILLGLATSVLALMQTGPRVYQKMATDGVLPGWLAGRRSQASAESSGGSLVPSIFTQVVLGVIVVSFATLRSQLDYLSWTLSISAALCGSLVFWLRNHPRHPVQVWGYPLIPGIYVLGTLTIATLTAYRAPLQAGVGMLTIAVGAVAYLIARLRVG